MLNLSPQVEIFLVIFISIIHVLAICLTFLRLYHRHSISRLWWDDYLAGVACIADCIAVLILWLPGSNDWSVEALMYKIGFLSIISVEWITRIALALAFARIFPPNQKTHFYAISLAILFLCLYMATIIQTVLFCNNDSAWITFSFVQCNFHGELIIFLVVANLLSDALLVGSPLYVLRHLRLPEDQRRLIFACFAGSTLMSTTCIATTFLQFAPESWEPALEVMRIIFGYLEGSVSLIVCNLLVIVTYFYKVYRQQRVTLETPTHNRSQEMYQTDPASRPTPLDTSEYVTSVNLTEISAAYFTDPITTSRRG